MSKWAGRTIRLDGTYRQEGEGNTVATVGGVVLVGVLGGFITGKSARIPQGRELTAFVEEPVELAFPARTTQMVNGVGPGAVHNPLPYAAPAPAYMQQASSPYEQLVSMIGHRRQKPMHPVTMQARGSA
jgi:hypothetical protein